MSEDRIFSQQKLKNGSRNYVFTLNNYTDEHEATLSKMVPSIAKYITYGREVGQEGTPHLQGYIELVKVMRYKKLSKMVPGLWCAYRKGSQEQAIAYCHKDDKTPCIYGTPGQQGERTDIADLYNMAKDNVDDCEIGESNPGGYLKYYKGIDRVKLNYARKDNKWAPVEVFVLLGEPGAGKTRYAYEKDPDLYAVPTPTSQTWFDGYTGQSTILIDDFNGCIRYSEILRLLDGYKFQLPVKNGFTWKRWKTVYITTNYHPKEWYSQKFNYSALERRIQIVEMK